MPFEIDRNLYARLYGPTTGDRVRLGDTNLFATVERDETSYGDEVLWGFGRRIHQEEYSSADASAGSDTDVKLRY